MCYGKPYQRTTSLSDLLVWSRNVIRNSFLNVVLVYYLFLSLVLLSVQLTFYAPPSVDH